MANEVLWKTTSQVTLASTAASVSSNTAVAPVSAGTLATSQHLNYPNLDFVLSVVFSSSVAAGGRFDLYARNLNIDGTADEDAPGASNAQHFVGAFGMRGSASSTTTPVYALCADVPSSPLGDVEYFIDNKTNGLIQASWTLKVTPKTFVPGT